MAEPKVEQSHVEARTMNRQSDVNSDVEIQAVRKQSIGPGLDPIDEVGEPLCSHRYGSPY